MYAKYGGYQHSDNELNIARFEVRPRYSPRLRKISTVYRVYCEGELLADTQSSINSAIGALVDAYSVDGLDFGFYTDAGAVTRHRLPASDPRCISPPRVVDFSHPVGDAAEFAVKRTYAITLEAEYLTPDSQIIAWEEKVEYSGNTGQRFEMVETFNGPIAQIVNKKTSQRIIQSGNAVGLQGYILPPGPLLPAWEHRDQRQASLGSARVMGLKALYYPSSWVYTHTVPTYTEVAPVTR